MSDLQNAEAFRAALESLQAGVCMVDQDQRITFWNEGAERITGYLRQDVLGRKCGGILSVKFCEERVGLGECSSLLDAALRDGQTREVRAYLHHKSGFAVPISARAVPIRDARGRLIGAAESFVERPWSSMQRAAQSDLAVGSGLDAVTQLPDYSISESYLEERLKFAAEHSMPFGLLCIQLDNLDDLRATHGREAVQAILNVVAHTLRNALDPAEFVGRWGEDQFLAIVAGWSDSEVSTAAERLRKLAQSSEIVWWGDHVSVSVSVGGSTLRPGEPAMSLLGRTGRALQQAAAQGGNRAAVIGASDFQSKER